MPYKNGFHYGEWELGLQKLGRSTQDKHILEPEQGDGHVLPLNPIERGHRQTLKQ